jgi:acetyl-CoA carboxylase biotin carboxylase subunit
MIRKVLVANRGEIACRILRTCRDMGIATAAVFSDADATARHVREAGEAVRIGASAPASSYLDITALIDAAKRTGANAVHPGYGFLAEHAPFAAACRAAGLIFIGPDPAVIARMGSKRKARRLMAAAGITVVPGYDGEEQSDERLSGAASEMGYPVMVKASAGGGGKGMRVVERERDLPAALAAARREALAAFGDATLLLERAIVAPRHVEVQIFGDAYGHVIHLGERECSIQRRHQKVIEETPSMALTPELRACMGAAAVAAGRRLGYTNAGTVEFILDPDGHFYFLEVNTRLQVEHAVTELVTGLDLVRWQILVAEGRPLPLAQEEVTARGHAIEARIYAEDPDNGFLPASGPVALWRPPRGEGIRVDEGIASGDTVVPYYDPLLAKISAHGADRAEALRRLERALAETTLLGVRNNLDLLRRTVHHPAHVAGTISTAFIERHAADLLAPGAADGAPEGAERARNGPRGKSGLAEPNALRNSEGRAGRDTGRPALKSPMVEGAEGMRTAALVAALQRHLVTPDPQTWRNNRYRPVVERFAPLERASPGGYALRRTPIAVQLLPSAAGAFTATVRTDAGKADEAALPVLVRERHGPDLWLEIAGHLLRAVALEVAEGEWWIKVGAATHVLVWRSPLPEPEEHSQAERSLAAPMPGQVVAVLVAAGQTVRAGDPLLILEAMKMEHIITAPHGGTVAAIHFRAGEPVPASAILLDLQPEPEA